MSVHLILSHGWYPVYTWIKQDWKRLIFDRLYSRWFNAFQVGQSTLNFTIWASKNLMLIGGWDCRTELRERCKKAKVKMTGNMGELKKRLALHHVETTELEMRGVGDGRYTYTCAHTYQQARSSRDWAGPAQKGRRFSEPFTISWRGADCMLHRLWKLLVLSHAFSPV